MKHFMMASHAKAKGPTPPVCKQPGARTMLAPEVTCPACLDWIAANYRDVITAVDKLRRNAA